MLRKKGKRAFAFMLCLCMVGLTACGSKPESGTQNTTAASGQTEGTKAEGTKSEGTTAKKDGGENTLLTEAGTYPIVNEPISMKMMIISKSYIEDFETNDFTKYLEELTGIDLSFEGWMPPHIRKRLTWHFLQEIIRMLS